MWCSGCCYCDSAFAFYCCIACFVSCFICSFCIGSVCCVCSFICCIRCCVCSCLIFVSVVLPHPVSTLIASAPVSNNAVNFFIIFSSCFRLVSLFPIGIIGVYPLYAFCQCFGYCTFLESAIGLLYNKHRFQSIYYMLRRLAHFCCLLFRVCQNLLATFVYSRYTSEPYARLRIRLCKKSSFIIKYFDRQAQCS